MNNLIILAVVIVAVAAATVGAVATGWYLMSKLDAFVQRAARWIKS